MQIYNIQSLVHDARHDDFCMTLDTNILLNYCSKYLKKFVPNPNKMNQEYVSAINTIYNNKKIKLCRIVHNEFHGVLYYWLCNQNYALYKKILAKISDRYAETILGDIKLHDGDMNISKTALDKVDHIRTRIKEINPNVYRYHVIRKEANISANGGRVRASVWRIPKNKCEQIQNFDPYEIYIDNDREILAYCISQPKRMVLYTNDTDFTRFKQEIEIENRNIRIFSDLDGFEYSPF